MGEGLDFPVISESVLTVPGRRPVELETIKLIVWRRTATKTSRNNGMDMPDAKLAVSRNH